MSPWKISEALETAYESDSPFSSFIHQKEPVKVSRKYSQNNRFKLNRLINAKKMKIEFK